jgi:hypothetical protein
MKDDMKKYFLFFLLNGFILPDENQLKLDFQFIMSQLALSPDQVKDFLTTHTDELLKYNNDVYLVQLIKRSYDAIANFNPEEKQPYSLDC